MESVEVEIAAADSVDWLRAMAHLPADAAVVLLTLGLLLVYVELNRPGWIVAGALGLLASLFAIASLGHLDLNLAAILMVMTAVVLLALELVRRTPWVVPLAATLALVLGLDHLVAGPGGMRVQVGTAVGCGVVVGVGTSILTRIARRARTNKGLD